MINHPQNLMIVGVYGVLTTGRAVFYVPGAGAGGGWVCTRPTLTHHQGLLLLPRSRPRFGEKGLPRAPAAEAPPTPEHGLRGPSSSAGGSSDRTRDRRRPPSPAERSGLSGGGLSSRRCAPCAGASARGGAARGREVRPLVGTQESVAENKRGNPFCSSEGRSQKGCKILTLLKQGHVFKSIY